MPPAIKGVIVTPLWGGGIGVCARGRISARQNDRKILRASGKRTDPVTIIHFLSACRRRSGAFGDLDLRIDRLTRLASRRAYTITRVFCLYMESCMNKLTLTVLVLAVLCNTSNTNAAAHDGEMIASACQACHGVDGISVSAEIPNLAGQKQDYLVAQLQAFKSGARKNELMNAIAAQLDDAQTKVLANYWSALPVSGSTAVDAQTPAARSSPMTFPDDFPNGFSEYRRDDSAGQRSISIYYANEAALAAARAEAPLPNGSMIVVGFYSAKADASGIALRDAQGRLQIDQLQQYSGMQSQASFGDEIPELLRNGDWRYGLFAANGSRKDAVNYAQCLACHKPLAKDNYVFSWSALLKAAHAPTR